MSLHVQAVPKAFRDMRSHAAFIASADRWRLRIVEAMTKLADQAERWPLVEDPGMADLKLREAILGRRPHVYRIWYDFDDERIVVYRIRHAAQDDLAEDDL